MRLVRFNRNVEPPGLARLGILVGADLVADLRAGYALYLHQQGDPHAREIAALRMPPAIAVFLQSGAVGRRALQQMTPWLTELAASRQDARGLGDEILFTPLAECRLHAPLRLTKLIVAYDNYRGRDVAAPSFVMKPSTAVVGPTRDITWPKGIPRLDCAAGLGVVIGTKCKDITESEAFDVIIGYTVVADVTARDFVGGGEAAKFTAGMFESFSPMGPWLISKGEVGDPMALQIELRVNGTRRQSFTTGEMLWPIPRLVAFLSKMTLEPGDVIWTGSALRSAGDSGLGAGDLVESSITGVGGLRNRVIG